jgi:pimeloyl-[acyl-carrier protein] methyl ester esterase
MSADAWEPLLPLADRCRPVAPHLRGHGPDTVPASFGLEELAADVADLFGALDLQGAVLAGWSLGSLVALAVEPLLRHRLARLVLLGGTARFTEAEGYPHGLPARELRGMAARIKRDYHGTLDGFVRGMFGEGELEPPQLEETVARLTAAAPSPETALAGIGILADADLRQRLAGIGVPTLVVHGEEDRVCPPGGAAAMAAAIPGARLAMLAGVGHAPFISRPGQVLALLEQFMEESA